MVSSFEKKDYGCTWSSLLLFLWITTLKYVKSTAFWMGYCSLPNHQKMYSSFPNYLCILMNLLSLEYDISVQGVLTHIHVCTMFIPSITHIYFIKIRLEMLKFILVLCNSWLEKLLVGEVGISTKEQKERLIRGDGEGRQRWCWLYWLVEVKLPLYLNRFGGKSLLKS